IRTDSDPVVPGEFFGQPKVTVSGREYTRLNSRLDDGCPELTGAASTPLTEANCRQLARAVYLSPPEASGRLVLVGAAVFVVDEMATAQAAAEVFQTRQGGVLALPVTADQIPGATVLSPSGDNSWRQALVRGHYVI
nr:hypothetical protein [Micromonospora sp. DSM 115978]